jgi:hypothetical protein
MCLLGMHTYKHVSVGDAFTGVSAMNAAKDMSVRIAALTDVTVRNASRHVA